MSEVEDVDELVPFLQGLGVVILDKDGEPIGGGGPAYESTWLVLEECVEGLIEQVQRELPADYDPEDEIE